MPRPRRLPVFLAAACLAASAGAREQAVKLPDIGSSAASLVHPADMHAYGAGMLKELRRMGLVLDDPLLADYLTTLGYRLVAHSQQAGSDFTFFMLRDPQINAFATLGGFIGVNAGLLTAMASEDQLAGVLAHEIAHVQQQHILRAFEDQQKVSIPVMLAMLGVMVAAAGRNDDTAPAALIAGTSLMQQRAINFTRSEEAEADRVGIQTLARAGFDPDAMAGAFQALQRVMRVNGVDIPEFLRTHPLDTNRIAEAKARAAQLQERPSAPVTAWAPDLAALGLQNLAPADPGAGAGGRAQPAAGARHFDFMRERARVLGERVPTQVRAYYTNSLRDNPSFATPANRYGHALALLATGSPGEARDALQALADELPGNLVVRLALAQSEEQAGDHAGALARFRQLQSAHPGNRAVALAYADALLARGDEASGREATELLRPLVERHAGDPDLQRSYARSNELAGDTVRAAEAYAEAAWLGGHAEDALNQLKRLAENPDLSYYQRSRIEARITRMTPEVLEARRRPTPESRHLQPALRLRP